MVNIEIVEIIGKTKCILPANNKHLLKNIFPFLLKISILFCFSSIKIAHLLLPLKKSKLCFKEHGFYGFTFSRSK